MERKDHEYSNLSTSKPPWLLSFHETSDNCKESIYFSLAEGIAYTGSIPHMHGKCCRGCFYGWLMLTDWDSGVCFLFNPISMETIQLPPLDVGDGIFHCVVILPPTDPNCRVLVIRTDIPLFFLSRPGAREWVKAEYDACNHIAGFAHCEGKSYFLLSNLDLATIEIAPRPRITEVIDVQHSGEPYGQRVFSTLIESREELFVVRRIFWGEIFWGESRRLRTVEVLRMDFESKVWVKVHNIGGRVFLCSGVYSLSYYPPANSMVKGDYIYIDDGDTNGSLNSFDLKDGSISILDARPNWFIPLSDNIPNQEKIETTVESNHGIPNDMANVQVGTELMLTDYTSPNSSTHSIPWLLFTHNNDGKWKFLDPAGGKVYVHHFPDLSDSTFCFAKDGWLVLSQGPTSVFFFNPFTTQRLDLPDWEKDMHKPFGMCFSAPPTSPDCIIFGIQGFHPCFINIWFCHVKDQTWTRMRLCDDTMPFTVAYNNPTYYEGLFYCLDCFGKLGVYDPSKNTWTVLSEPRGVNLELKCSDEQAHMCYLVETGGDLCSVFTSKHEQPPVHVFKLDRSNKMEWVEIQSLGDQALYLSQETSLCVSSVVEGLENKIYFPKFYKDASNKLVFYSMETGTCNAKFYEAKECVHRIWIHPNLI